VTPGAAFLYIRADEAAAEAAEFQLRSADGESVHVVRVLPGERVIAQHASLGGNYTVEVQPAGCSLDVTLTGGSETDVTFTDAAPECLELAGTHEAGAMPHPFFGALTLTVTGAGATQPVAELSSLDSPPNPGLGIIEADETGRYYVTDLPPGR
jgi:hypothetical protein